MWIGKRLKKYVFSCPDGTEWSIGKKISEKEREYNPWPFESSHNTSEAQAVYHCRQTLGASVGMRAILKVRMQIPEDDLEDVSPDPKVRAKEASNVYTASTAREMHALDWLTERDCSVTPRLICLAHSVQDGYDMPVPGGWLVFILMERAPGVPLTGFQNYDFATREKIRQAFRESLIELYSHHVTPLDNNPANIIYDEKQNRCYFVDFEDAWIDDTEPPLKFYDSDYKDWWLDDEKLGIVDPAPPAIQDD